MSGANLSGADLTAAVLTAADLSDTRIDGANLGATVGFEPNGAISSTPICAG
ncbi:MAG: pentapeptide repeat-containing protein [Aliidongia sp.]